MKTLILYATKYGAAYEIARRIADKIADSVIFNLKDSNIPPISRFDCVIIGSSLYAGMIQKSAKSFVSQNAKELKMVKLGLYLSGMGPEPEKYNAYFEGNFPSDILYSASAKEFLGGIYDPKKAGFIDRMIYKAVSKQSDYVNTISDAGIDEFVRKLLG